MKVNVNGLLVSYVECLDAAKAVALNLSAHASAEVAAIAKIRVDAFTKTADQYLGALKLIWARLPPKDADELAATVDQVAEAAFKAESEPL